MSVALKKLYPECPSHIEFFVALIVAWSLLGDSICEAALNLIEAAELKTSAEVTSSELHVLVVQCLEV